MVKHAEIDRLIDINGLKQAVYLGGADEQIALGAGLIFIENLVISCAANSRRSGDGRWLSVTFGERDMPGDAAPNDPKICDANAYDRAD